MSAEHVRLRLNELLADAGLAPLDEATGRRFEDYLSLFLHWNARLNLSAVRDKEGILSRHFVESIACAQGLPTEIATLLDFGSGAGLPGIPIALCRPGVYVTLAESQGKKAAFLREVIRVLGIDAVVHAGRAELLIQPYDCVTLRAVDRMALALKIASRLVAPAGWLALMTTKSELAGLQGAAGAEFSWRDVIPLPGSNERILAMGRRSFSSPA